MARQDTENLFRRYKNQFATIKMTSGGLYKGRIVEVTNDYVAIAERDSEECTFVLFNSIESVVVQELPTNP